MRKKWLYGISLVVVTGTVCWFFRKPLGGAWRSVAVQIHQAASPKSKPDPQRYAVLKDELEAKRLQFSARLSKAKNSKERAMIEGEARLALEQALPSLMRCWLGTPWDFYGTAEGPGGGKIACGYFVSTVMKDAGFRVDRYRLAQQPSGNILQTFLTKKNCTLTIGTPYISFAEDLCKAEPGIYIVGLDSHVAFLVVKENGFHFIHSSGSRPWCVVDETQVDAHALERSNWRMIGNLTASPEVIRLWLKGSKIPVKGA